MRRYPGYEPLVFWMARELDLFSSSCSGHIETQQAASLGDFIAMKRSSEMSGTGCALLALGSLLVLLAAGCSHEQKKTMAPPAVPVTIATVVSRDVPVQVKAVGNV